MDRLKDFFGSFMVRVLSLVGSLVSLLPTIPLITQFNTEAHGMQFVEKAPWIERFNIFYSLGIDGLSMWFIPLTAFITVIVVISAWEVITERVAQYMSVRTVSSMPSGLTVPSFNARMLS